MAVTALTAPSTPVTEAFGAYLPCDSCSVRAGTGSLVYWPMLMTGIEVLNERVELITRGRAVSGAHEAGLFLAIERKGWLVCRAGQVLCPLTVTE